MARPGFGAFEPKLKHPQRTANGGKSLARICLSKRVQRKRANLCFLVLLAVGSPDPASALNTSSSPGATSGPIVFEEIATQSGVNFSIDSSPTPNKNQIETMVAGVAPIDYAGDGYQDIFFANGAAIPSLQKDGPQNTNRLFPNNGDGTFTDVTDKAGVGGDGYDMGVAVGDFDNDGRPDLYVVGVTKNHLYRNNGDGTFSDVTDKAGVGGGVYDGKKMWSVAAAWVDYNNEPQIPGWRLAPCAGHPPRSYP